MAPSVFTEEQKLSALKLLRTNGGEYTGLAVAEKLGVSRNTVDQWQAAYKKGTLGKGQKAKAAPKGEAPPAKRGPGRPRKEAAGPASTSSAAVPDTSPPRRVRSSSRQLVDLSKPDQVAKAADKQLEALRKEGAAIHKQLDATREKAFNDLARITVEMERQEKIRDAFRPPAEATSTKEGVNGAREASTPFAPAETSAPTWAG